MAFVLRILSIVCLQIKTNKNKIQQRASSIDLLRDPGQKKLLPIFIVVFFRYRYVDVFVYQMEF